MHDNRVIILEMLHSLSIIIVVIPILVGVAYLTVLLVDKTKTAVTRFIGK
jgi:hypothetical protein